MISARNLASLAVVVALATTLAAACDRAPRPGAGRTLALAAQTAGVWQAEFRLTRTPQGPAPAGAASVRGSLALLDSRDGVGREWLHRAATHVGVYDADFRPFGFEAERAGPVPTLVAAVALPDTLLAATPAGTEGGSLALVGVVAGDSVVGTWSYATHAVGGWGGAFTLHRVPPGRR